jgi:hypothetical protein
LDYFRHFYYRLRLLGDSGGEVGAAARKLPILINKPGFLGDSRVEVSTAARMNPMRL